MCTLKKKKFLTNSGRKKSASGQRDPPAKIVLAKFLRQNDSKRLYVVSLHCWRCFLTFVHGCSGFFKFSRGLVPIQDSVNRGFLYPVVTVLVFWQVKIFNNFYDVDGTNEDVSHTGGFIFDYT